MIVLLTEKADLKTVRGALTSLGLWTSLCEGQGQRALLVEPHSSAVSRLEVESIPGVAAVLAAPSPQPRIDAIAGSCVRVGPALIGAPGEPVLMAGPCSVESRAQLQEAAAMAAAAGAQVLRGGAFKPRTSPYSFSGHGREALRWLREAADEHELGLVTEAMSEDEVPAVAEVADLIQVGTRNMQNFSLLRRIGETGKPVLLKRGMAARIDEWLLAGEHLMKAGASFVIFCERGIVGFDPKARNLLDLAAVAHLKLVHRQLVLVDPSHATGRRDLIPALARASLAVGADGLLIEAHPDSACALSDGPQALDAEGLAEVGRLFTKNAERPLAVSGAQIPGIRP